MSRNSDNPCPRDNRHQPADASHKGGVRTAQAWLTTWPLYHRRFANAIGIVLLWLGYVTMVEWLAHWVAADKHLPMGPGPLGPFVQERVDEMLRPNSRTPPLARWDSAHFHDVALSGYAPTSPLDSDWPTSSGSTVWRPVFLPGYPLAMRLVAVLLHVPLYTAGLWVSRIALLATLALLYTSCAHDADGRDDFWPTAVALLFFPSSFILVSVYSESLFLALAAASFVLSKRRHYTAGALAAIGASLTRINGLTLIPSLVVLAWEAWRKGERRLAAALPALGAAVGFALLTTYDAWQFGDPFAYLTAKGKFWGITLAFPWNTIAAAVTRAKGALASGELGRIYTCLELPCLSLAVLAAIYFVVQRRWAEGTFVAANVCLITLSNTLWGTPRFVLLIFPMFLMLGKLQRASPVLWHLYLLAGAMLQACLLVNYVCFRHVAP